GEPAAQDGQRHRRGPVGPTARAGAGAGDRQLRAHGPAALGGDGPGAGEAAAGGVIRKETPMSATAAAGLIPVRALNQVMYCPRLYFLQYVDCVMPTNEHVEGGLFDHRRVTAPELANRTRKEGEALHTRSVQLSSEKLGLTGVLDVVEERKDECYP